MKVRKGFVSNSSSSSFVVAFPHKPKSIEDLKKIMFGNQEWHYTGYAGYSEKGDDAPTLPMVEKVFAQIKKKATKKEICEAIGNGWFDPYPLQFEENLPGHYSGREEDPEWKKLNSLKHGSEEWLELFNSLIEESEKINNKRAKDIANFFIEMNKNKYIAVMFFSDNEGDAVEEHSNIFYRLDSIQTSYH